MSSIKDDRLWIDGCFDFTHHGHAGALLQARQLGNELIVGIHTDEEIELNKGPVVMHLEERVMAVEACKWCTATVPGAPYVTDPKVMDSYGCKYVVHGDDITTDADGNDCYQQVKDMGRFLVVKRTPNISTTDLVGRMLSHSTSHHLPGVLSTNRKDHFLFSEDSLSRFKAYATGPDGKSAGSAVLVWQEDTQSIVPLVEAGRDTAEKLTTKSYYVDGGFDLFFMGHIEFLRVVHDKARAEGAGVVVGIHDDATVNSVKELNYPIMNHFERALCVLQCKYVEAVILGAPFVPHEQFITEARANDVQVTKVLHGPTPVVIEKGTKVFDPYEYVKAQGLYENVGPHKYDEVSSSTLVARVLHYKEAYEERQRKKGWKAENEKVLREREIEREAGNKL